MLSTIPKRHSVGSLGIGGSIMHKKKRRQSLVLKHIFTPKDAGTCTCVAVHDHA